MIHCQKIMNLVSFSPVKFVFLSFLYLSLIFQYFYGISSDVDAEHAGKLIKVNAKTGTTYLLSVSLIVIDIR